MEQKNGNVDSERLLSYIERIERLEEEKKALQNDIKEIFEEAKSANFDVKALKAVLKRRKLDEHEREELDFIQSVYESALGMS